MNSLPLLLVPGLMCDHTVWDPVIPALSASRTCSVVDHRNTNTLGQMAAQLLDDAPDRFLLAGHSMGGRVAMEVVRIAPHRVAGLALLDTGYLAKADGEEGDEEVRKRMALLHIAQTQGVRAMAQEWVKGMVHPNRLSDSVLLEAILKMFERKSAEIFANQLHALIERPDATPVLQSIQVPSLILCGLQDSWATPAQHQAMQYQVPHAVISMIDGAGHMAPMERPQAVSESMLKWLSDC